MITVRSRIIRLLLPAMLLLPLRVDAAAGKLEWQPLAALIGQAPDASTTQKFIESAGKPREWRTEARRVVRFPKCGVSLEIVDGKIRTVTLQIAPGSKIGDSGYQGSLPFDRAAIDSGPEKAIATLGKPGGQGVHEGDLVYDRQGFRFTLIYRPQLDYITIRTLEK